MADPTPIRVFAQDGRWLVDYGSYAHGYHTTRREAVESARRAARDEHREFVVDAKPGKAGMQ
jgi:Uncharacterized protein conserved in bacteria (DUF2188)